MSKKQRQGYYESQNRFNRIDGDKFGACMKQIFDLKSDNVLEWRVRKSDNKMCIIEFYEDGKGYSIYEITE